MGDPITTTVIVTAILAATAAVALSASGGGSKDFGSGPRLTDLKTVEVSEGGKMWRAAGNRARTPGQIIFVTKIHEKKSKQSVGSGKSAGSVTVYKYSVDIAVAIGQAFGGTDGKGAIEKLWQIRCNGKLIYNAKKKKKGKQRYSGLGIKLGDEAQTPASIMTDKYGSGNVSNYYNTAYIAFNELKLEDFGNQIPQVWEFVWQPDAAPYEVGDAIVDVVTRVPGLTAADVDVTNATGEATVSLDTLGKRPFGGMQYAGPTPATEILATIVLLYDLSVQETNEKLVFFDRGKEKVIEVLPEHMGFASGRPDVSQLPCRLRDRDDLVLPSEVVLNYLDEEQGWKRTSVRQRIDGAISGDNVLEYDVPFVLEREQARRIVRRRAFEPYKHRLELVLQLPPDYIDVQESDVLAVPFKGQRYYCFVVKKTTGADWTLEFQTVVIDIRAGEDEVLSAVSGSWNGDLEDTLNTLDPTPDGDDDDYQSPIVATALMNLPAITDEECSKIGFWMAHAAEDLDAVWIAAALFRANKPGGKYKQIDSEAVAPEYMIGFTRTTLADSTAKAGYWDRHNTVDVQLFEGACATLDDDDVLAGSNWLAIGSGNNFEVIGYRDAEVLTPVEITLPSGTVNFIAPNIIEGTGGADFAALGVQVGVYIRILGAQEEANQDVLFKVVSFPLTNQIELDTATLVNESAVPEEVIITQGNLYRLSHLLRGLRNTEDHCSQHTTGDRVVSFVATQLLFLPHANGELNKKRYFKDVPEGLELADVTAQEFTSVGETVRAFSPVLVRAERLDDGDGTITLKWWHRTRLTHTQPTDLDLHGLEPNEEFGKHGDRVKFRISVHSDAGRTVLERQVDVVPSVDHDPPTTAPLSWSYTPAMQTDDGTLGAQVWFTIRQITKPPVTFGNPTYCTVE